METTEFFKNLGKHNVIFDAELPTSTKDRAAYTSMLLRAALTAAKTPGTFDEITLRLLAIKLKKLLALALKNFQVGEIFDYTMKNLGITWDSTKSYQVWYVISTWGE